MTTQRRLRDELDTLAASAGLHAIGVTGADPLIAARRALQAMVDDGRASDMQFTLRNPTRSTSPRASLRSARSVIAGAWAYLPPSIDEPSEPSGRVAAYAVEPHYTRLRTALNRLAERLHDDGWSTCVLIDDNALADRAVALRAGLGWAGRNSNVLIPGRGSWFVLGSVVTDAPLAPDTPIEAGCGPCRRCLTGCPTGAIVADGLIDAERCLAWLVQRAGSFPLEHRRALGTRIYGCDDCQTVCPPNRGLSASRPTESGAVGLIELLEKSDEALLEDCADWYIADRDPDIVRRNAVIAIGNCGPVPDDLVTRIARVLDETALRSAMLAEHVRWAHREREQHDCQGARSV